MHIVDGRAALSEEVQKEIDEEIARALPDKQIPEDFHVAVAEAIATYRAGRQLVEASKPAVVRDKLRQARNATEKVYRLINELDANARALLCEMGTPSRQLEEQAKAVHKALSDAFEVARGFQHRGRLPDQARLDLAADLARAIRTHLLVRVTAGRMGAYQALLEIVLKAATGRPKEVKDVHDLAGKALRDLDTHQEIRQLNRRAKKKPN